MGGDDWSAYGVRSLGGTHGHGDSAELVAAISGCCRYGREHLDEIVAVESAGARFPPEVVREYLTRYIVHELGPRDYQGMELFLDYARGDRDGTESVTASLTGVAPLPYTGVPKERPCIFWLMIVHVIVCLFLIIVVLLQSGKAADLAGAFGGMGSQTAFGPRGSATLLSKATTISAILFMVTSLSLSILATRNAGLGTTVLETAPKTRRAEDRLRRRGPAPAAPADGPLQMPPASQQADTRSGASLHRRRSSTPNAEVAELADALA